MQPNFGFNGFGEFVFYRTYSREKADGTQENWADVVIRVTEGVFSIREKHYNANGIDWDQGFWETYAHNFAISMFNMEWLPPGRGLWAMGTDFMWERGSMALQNCGYLDILDLSKDAAWVMDALMCGVGVGFKPIRDDNLKAWIPSSTESYIFKITDDREGWTASVSALLDSYLYPESTTVEFDYSEIRPLGEPIKGFGGIASGPEPLKRLHDLIRGFMLSYINDNQYDSVRLKMDTINAIGACVVAGNVRRSAEIALMPISDKTFIDLKDYDKYPERAAFGWLSNNSVILEDPEDFQQLGMIAERVIKNGEPGYLNLNTLNEGRLGKDDDLRKDNATGLNPCGEQPLESGELCCLAETLPTRCKDAQTWYKACEYATMYASSVTLLPTHSSRTNAVIARNRRIGVSIVDVTGWLHNEGAHNITKYLRKGYEIVRGINKWVNSEAGIPESIRVTTIKPGGTIPKIAGKTGGVGFPTFHHTLMRVRVAANSKTAPILIEAGIPNEPDIHDPDTLVFEWPVLQGPAKPATEATLWEQAMNVIMIQREWSDNAVSNTLYFKPKWVLEQVDFEGEPILESHKVEVDNWGRRNLYRLDPNHEENDIPILLGMIAPLTKSISLLPHAAVGVYPQSPQTGITEKEYNERLEAMTTIDWSKLTNHTPTPDMYCSGDKCEIKE
jgi:ribonucleoside-diphosphate reductase alpha chain